ncbi:hypothetical protein PR202_gb21639 [Eleusine coracana subsp. coracana]|uniref:Uncharacterized protein n=1 Tax=Eleusine coracana subsp. coracana TaxID=191504 RepID=A0AAV5FDM5_ELECO|nr:hypothetical protein PR202_gb21639 [Eleusine coracana subsp. coracana]
MFAYCLQCIRGKALFFISNNASHSKKAFILTPHSRRFHASAPTAPPPRILPRASNADNLQPAAPRDAAPHKSAAPPSRVTPLRTTTPPLSSACGPRARSAPPRSASSSAHRFGDGGGRGSGSPRPRLAALRAAPIAHRHSSARVGPRRASSSRGLASPSRELQSWACLSVARGPSPRLPASLRRLELPPRARL